MRSVLDSRVSSPPQVPFAEIPACCCPHPEGHAANKDIFCLCQEPFSLTPITGQPMRYNLEGKCRAQAMHNFSACPVQQRDVFLNTASVARRRRGTMLKNAGLTEAMRILKCEHSMKQEHVKDSYNKRPDMNQERLVLSARICEHRGVDIHARPWTLEQRATKSPHCSFQSCCFLGSKIQG